jgi:secreted trypsin-like serine protease
MLSVHRQSSIVNRQSQGDSGGPVLDKASQKQVGVVSFANGCGTAGFAGVNARVTGALDWIDQSICQMSRTPPATCFPYLVVWGECIGTLVAADIVLTAGHCGHWDTGPLESRQITFPSNPSMARNIIERTVHSLFNYYTRDADVQLLKLDSSALIDVNGSPTGLGVASLRRNAETPARTLSEISTRSGDNANLQQVSLELATDDACPMASALTNEMMCTVVAPQGYNSQANTCTALSGSPIIDENRNIISVSSWGKLCVTPSLSGASTKISSVATWIDSTICRWSAYDRPADVACDPSVQAATFELTGPGAFVITVKHNEYSEEVAWRLLHEASTTELYYQPYNGVTEEAATVTERFEQLPVGSYRLDLSDMESG